MAQKLKPEQFKRIIELVAPHMSSENRRTYITPWCMNHSKLYGRIDWNGAERAFTTRVVELFLNRGQLEPNKSALQAFLEAVRDNMGDEDQAEIDSILQKIVSSRKGPVTRPLPPQSQRATYFTGRKTILADLCQSLQSGKMVALCGPGGIGKTTLAVEAVYSVPDDDQLDQRFPDGVLFHSFYDEQETDLALDNLLRQLGEQPLPPVEAHAQRVFTQRQLLLILDGAEDATDLPAVINLRGNCGVLITTRQRRDARGCTRLDVEPFEDDDAVDLLRRLVDDPGRCDAKTAQAICQRVGNLPLAVQLVGYYMFENGLLGQEFLAWLQQTPLEALDQGKRRQESVPILLERSLAGISEAARDALALIGQLALAPVDSALLASALEQVPEQMPRLLGELVNLNLLRREDDGRYGVSHALIHTYASAHMKPSSDSLERLGRTYAGFAKKQSALGLEGYGHLDPERVHLLTVAQACTDAGLWSVVDRLVWTTHEYLDIQGHWKQRIALLHLGIQSAKELSNHRNYGAHQGHLRSAYSALGRVPETIDSYEQILTTLQEVGDRKGEGTNLGNQGSLYSALGRVPEDINYYRQALTISQKVGDRCGESRHLGNLGNAYCSLGRVVEAMGYYEQALTIAKKIGDRSSKGIHLINLGRAHAMLDDRSKAISFCQQGLDIHRQTGDRNKEGGALNYLGYSYGVTGQWDRAIELHLEAIEIQEEVDSRYQLGHTWNDLGETYIATDQLAKAESAFDQALTLAQEVGDRWGEAQCQWNRGLLYKRQGKAAEAVAAMQVCVDYFQEIGHVEAGERAAQVGRMKVEGFDRAYCPLSTVHYSL